MLTTAAAAKLLGLSERQVQHLAASHQIPGATKFGSAWQFPHKPRVIRPKRGRPVQVTMTITGIAPVPGGGGGVGSNSRTTALPEGGV